MTALEGWSVRPLGELVEVLDARRVPVSATQRAERHGDVPYFGAAGQVGWIDDFLFDEDLVLLGEDGVQFFDPYKSKAYRISGRSWVNNHAHVLRAGRDVDWRYLKSYLNWFDYRGYANGTTRLKLTKAAMRRMPIAYPRLTEQRRIVDILEDHLSRLDAADKYLAAALKRTRTHHAAMLSSLAVISDPSTSLSSLTVASGYGTSTKCVPNGIGPAVVRIPNLKDGAINLADEKRAADPTTDLSSLMLRPGDLLIVRTNGSRDLIGRTAVVQQGIEAAFASYLIRYRFEKTRIRPEWAHLMLSRPQARATLEALAASSAGQYNLGLKKLDVVQIPLPPVDEQRRRINRYRPVIEHIDLVTDTVREMRRRTSKLRRALLAAAFSGRLTGRSSDLDIVEEMAFA